MESPLPLPGSLAFTTIERMHVSSVESLIDPWNHMARFSNPKISHWMPQCLAMLIRKNDHQAIKFMEVSLFLTKGQSVVDSLKPRGQRGWDGDNIISFDFLTYSWSQLFIWEWSACLMCKITLIISSSHSLISFGARITMISPRFQTIFHVKNG